MLIFSVKNVCPVASASEKFNVRGTVHR